MTVALLALALSVGMVSAKDLCNSAPGKYLDSSSGFCQAAGVFGGEKVDWSPCCSFEFSVESSCRTYEFGVPYCQDLSNICSIPGMSTINTCDSLSKEDVLSIELEFEGTTEVKDCCKGCSCYGDPECISFTKELDLWIPCDARVNDVSNDKDCKINKDVCTDLVDPNGNKCVWNGGNNEYADGSKIKIDGSPCVSDPSGPASTMNMFRTSSNSLDLELGERGVIDKIYLKHSRTTYALNAEECFVSQESGDENASPFTVDGVAQARAELPADWTVNVVNSDLIYWYTIDDRTGFDVTIQCLRAGSKTENGKPRINVDLHVPSGMNGQGFCNSNKINEKSGDFIENLNLHTRCTLSKADSVQACKNLVSESNSLAGLDMCANEYCQLLFPLGTGDFNRCKSRMQDGSNQKKWVNQYCTSVHNAFSTNLALDPLNGPGDVNRCVKQVNFAGYFEAVTLWGKGYGYPTPEADPVECKTDLEAYAISSTDTPCGPGVYIDTKEAGSVEWVQSYFVPKDAPFCNNKIEANARDNRKMFTHLVRVRQCDGKVHGKGSCAASNNCETSVGVKFSVTFSNDSQQLKDNLLEQFNNGNLACRYKEGETTATWCLEDLDYEPAGDVCPCPPDGGRRVLTQENNLAPRGLRYLK